MSYNYAVIDVETTGLNRFKDTITYIGIGLVDTKVSLDIDKYIIIPMDKSNSLLRWTKIVEKLKKNRVKLVYQNGKFDTLFIDHHYNIVLPIHHDVMLMGTAYDLSAKHGLKAMAQNYLEVDDWDISKKEKTAFNSSKVESYLRKDLEYTWKLFSYFKRNMDLKQKFIYNNLLKPAYLMYRRVEKAGIYINQEGLKKVKREYQIKQQETHEVLKKRHDINWNSPIQVSKALFSVDKLPTLKLSEKTGNPSSDAKVLRRLAAKGYDLPTKLLEYKFYYGANTKFLNKWGDYAQYDGRIHPSFNITNVITGRTSCSEPNLQQVPRNPELRNLYTAPEGRVLIEADYSQIELRIAADYANDKAMLNIYNTGGDIHLETASSISGVPKHRVTKEQRSKAKAVNFGFLYGMSARGFTNYAFDSYGVVFGTEEAERYRQLFFQKYSGLLPWHKEMEILCEAMGGVENRFGRFRSLPKIYSSSRYDRGEAIRRAINTPVQGTASDLLLLSAIEIDNKLRSELNLQIVGTVHDSILIECPEDVEKYATKEVKKIMSAPEALDVFDVSFKIPLEVDVAVGSWGSK